MVKADFEVALQLATQLDFLFEKGNFDQKRLLGETVLKRLYVEDGKITIIGPDIKDMEEGSGHPIGIYIEVAGKDVEEDLEGVIERRIHEYSNFIEGIMHLNQRYDIHLRLTKKSFQKGFNSFKVLGEVYQRLYKSELPIIEKKINKALKETSSFRSYYLRVPPENLFIKRSN